MPVDYYPNKTFEDLLKLLDTVQKRQTHGALTEVSAAGVRTVRTFQTGSARPEQEILRILYSLHLRAADTDEAANWPNPYANRIRRTLPSYR